MMKFSAYTILLLPALVVALDGPNYARHHHYPRQVVAASSSATSSLSISSTSTASAAATATANATALVSGATTSSNISTLSFPSVSFSLQATNPTAVPLSSIVYGATSQPTQALSFTATVGAVPTLIAGAPPLPNAALLIPGNYPPLDKIPPIDSPEVQQWIQEVADSGVTIPTFSPTNPGGCPANPQAIADDAERCWWTCGGCTSSTDVTTCPNKMTWGSSFDDGPAMYTPTLLDYLESNAITSTFFVVGSRCISQPVMLQSEYAAGHQIAVHTWSHPSLTTISTEEVIAELGWSKKVIKDILGVTPTMMRPPYGDIDNRIRAICQAMELVPVIWTRISARATFDTGDFNIAGGSISAPQVLLNWENILTNASTINTGFIVLEHDLFEQTVDLAVGYILPDAMAQQPPLKIEPIITCLGMPLSDAYVETNNNVSDPLPLASVTPVSGSAQATGAVGSTSDAIAVNDVALVSSAFGVLAGVVAVLL